jgi:hypothetical protein
MTTATSLIQSAYREGNLIAVGKQPTSAEQTEALLLLNNFVLGIFGYEMGENLQDWLAPSAQRTAPVPANYPQLPIVSLDDSLSLLLGTPGGTMWAYPPRNRRIVWGGVTATVYFPEAPMDGSRMAVVQGSGAGDSGAPGAKLTLDGNGRTIETTNTVQYTDPLAPRQWLYRADVANWLAVVTLGLNDQCPFPQDFDDFFICALAMRLAPRYSKITAAETQKTALDTLKRLKARYRQAGVTTYGGENIPGSAQSYLSGRPWW